MKILLTIELSAGILKVEYAKEGMAWEIYEVKLKNRSY